MSAPSDAKETSDPSDLLALKIRALSAEFASTLKGSVEDVRQAWSNLSNETVGKTEAANLSRIQDIAHSLAGAGKSLGFPQISQAAAPLDSLFRLLLENKSPLTQEEVDQINLLISDLDHAVDVPGETVLLDDLHVPFDPDARGGAFQIMLFDNLDPQSEALSPLKEIGYSLIQVASDEAPPAPAMNRDPVVLLAAAGHVSRAHMRS